MKKLLMFALVAGLSGMVACGPSADEKAAEEKRIKDSTEAAEAAMKAAEEAAMAAMAADTTVAVDSAAAPAEAAPAH